MLNLADIVVRIYDMQTKEFLGCGFFLDSNYIVTCLHVVGKRKEVTYQLHNFCDTAEIIYCNENYDFVYLYPQKIPTGYVCMFDIATPNDELLCGTDVITYGYSKHNPSRGVPTSFKFAGNSTKDGGITFLAFDMANSVTRGYSGSPVVTKDDRLIGMINEITSEDKYKRGTEQCFAIPLVYLVKPNIDLDSAKKALNVSRNYIKSRVSSTLFNLDSVESIDIGHIKRWFSLHNGDNYTNWLNLFHSLISIRKPLEGESGTKITVPDTGVLVWIKDTIQSSEFENPITIRGAMKSGKSMFLSFYFMYLLNMHIHNQFDYIPLYINIEKYKKHAGELTEFVENATKAYDELIRVADDLSQNYNKRICFIIDGLSENNYYGTNEIEYYIISKSRSRRKKGVDIQNKYLYVIDTDKDIQTERTCISEERNADYLIYFDPINKIKIYPGIDSYSDFTNFINYYCLVLGLNKTNPQTIVKSFFTLNLPYIDIHFLTQFGSKLSNDNYSESVSTLYQNYFHDIVSENYKSETARAAFLMYYSNNTQKTYSTFKDIIDIETFEIIKNEKILANYLVALYYVTNIKNYNDKKETDFDILNLLFNKDVSVFIVDIIRSKQLNQAFITAAKTLYEKLKNSGRASLTYLLGRMDMRINRIHLILEDQKEILENEKVDCSDIYRLAAERSLVISKINTVDSKESIQFSNEYLVELLKNSQKRAVNRAFHRLFYGDISVEDFEETSAMDVIGQGFDFYNTFHRIAVRIKSEFIERETVYPLLHVELFTLCNLIQVRLQESCIKTKTKEIPSFFFHYKYSSKCLMVANQLLLFLTKYLERHTWPEDNHPVTQYFILIRNLITEYIANLKDEKPLKAYNPASIIGQIEQLYTVERIGWKNKDYVGNLTKEMIDSLPKTAPLETVVEHVYSTYIIGLFFLPKDIQNNVQFSDIDYNDRSRYSKQQILNLVMIHDLGESKVSDYPPYLNDIRPIAIDEDAFNRQLFLHGTYVHVADVYEYFELWDAWSKKYNNDINVRIAKELDKIQFLFKYCSLTIDDKLDFTEQRKENILSEVENVTTSVGKKILKLIVIDNPVFKDVFSQ